jgi:hypothetical protein
MTDDEICTLGDYGECLLQHEAFAAIVSQFEHASFVHWLATDPKNIKERESIFAKTAALREEA